MKKPLNLGLSLSKSTIKIIIAITKKMAVKIAPPNKINSFIFSNLGL